MAELQSLGKYEIRREIGRGAMGVVYEGYDPMIKRVVALKTIRPDQLGGEEAASLMARFRREAQAAGRLNHPNIVAVYDFGEDPGSGTWFIAMECVAGRDLKACFEGNERFATEDAVRIMGQILDALDYSHRQGVVHRDIKPANIFLLPDGSVKVADFGIAHIDSSSLTQVGTVLGTPSYMSPEQIMGLPVDGRSDLFSAGVILYQFLTGERPFAGSTATATMQKVLKQDPMPPSSLNTLAPPAMDAVVRKALAKQPDERFRTGQEFAAALRAAAQTLSQGRAQGGPPGASEATLVDAPAQAPGGNPAVAQAAPPVPLRKQGDAAHGSRGVTMALIAAAAVVAVVALGTGTWYALQRKGGDGAAPPQATASPQPAAVAAAPAASAPTAAAPAAALAPKAAPGTLLVSAVGLADPSDARYQGDKSLLQADLRADSRSQAVEKALALLVDAKSLAKNYDVLREKLLANSGSYVTSVVRESEPRVGKDGLASMTTEAVVNVKAVQKSLNQMSREERIELIRAAGDPKVAVRVTVRDADQPEAPPQISPVAENILKERIKGFGFRTWSEGDAGQGGADFLVLGEAKVKRLSLRLEASGLTVTKYALSSWTVKCIERETGEEIYYNTALPKGLGSWPSEEEALKAIGAKVADEFSRDFFQQHVAMTGKPVTIRVRGLPGVAVEDLLARELIGLPEVIAAAAGPPVSPRSYDLKLAGSGAAGDLVAQSVLKPLNAKLGQACFSLGVVAGDEVAVEFDQRCADPAVIARFETNPPAGLYGAPPSRQRAVVKNPETLRKLMI